jgi:hypothetical protein
VTPGHEHAENAGRLQRLHYVERNSPCRLNLGPTRDDVGRQFANAFEHTFILICHGASLRPYGYTYVSMPENKVTVVARSTAGTATRACGPVEPSDAPLDDSAGRYIQSLRLECAMRRLRRRAAAPLGIGLEHLRGAIFELGRRGQATGAARAYCGRKSKLAP